jgi:trimeric autotransporter adhesin
LEYRTRIWRAPTASFTLTTTGTGAATLSGTTLNIPSVSSTVNAGSISGTIAVANGGTGVTTSTGTGNVVLSTSPTLITPALGTPSAVVLTSATGLPLTTGVTGTLAVGNGGTGATTLTGYVKGTGTTAMTASANIPVADVTGAAPLASPTFTGTVTTATINTGALSATSVNTPIYASTPQALTDGETISWNPTLGLNASVTLAGNRTLSFTSTPAVGSYGTVVLTQDGTGGRTITLPTIPSVTNKVLGSATNTTVSLSTAANAKDILNFYYDGTNCYWNIGQGYGNAPTASFTLTTTGTGAATLSGTTLNIPSVSSTVNSGSISGTIAVANGGTGATSITGLVKGNGSGAMTAATAGTDYLLPTGNAATATLATTAITAGNITATSNGTLTSLSSLNTVGTITTGTISVTTDIKTSGTLTAGAVTYPNIHGTSGQVLSTTGSGTLTWTTTAAPSDASTTAKGLIQLAGDLRGTATSPTVNTVGGVNSSTITTFDTRITSVTNSTTSNTSSITSLNTSVNAATNINTISTIVKRDESGNFSAGTITANLTGNVTGSLTGNATTATTAGNVTGTVAGANGGTGVANTGKTITLGGNITTASSFTTAGAFATTLTSSAATNITLPTTGTLATLAGTETLTNKTLTSPELTSPSLTGTPTAPTAVVGTNNTQIATTAFVKAAIRLNSDEFTATTGQTSFAFTTASSNTGAVQIPLTKPFMYINGTRIKNTAYSWTAGTSTVTYNPTNNSSYTLVAGDRIQFDYAY